MNLLILVVVVFFNLSIHANEEIENPIDIATCIKNRNKQYSLNEYENIWVISPVRTGSTLIYNVLRILFESEDSNSKVYKCHYVESIPKDKRCLCVFTLREPRESCFSWYRVHKNNLIIDREWVRRWVEMLACQWGMLNQLQDQKIDFIILKYEKFVENLDYVFNNLESTLSISIDDQDRALIKRALSKENVLKNIKKIDSFDKWDPILLFHGKHVDQNEISDNEKEYIEQLINECLLDFDYIFKQWGYRISS